MLMNISLVVLAYLLGSISSAVVICKLMQFDDPRAHGSNNPGATNMLRLHGKPAALFTLAGDVFKGLLPVMLAHALQVSELIVALTALAAFAGHLYPVFFGFRGGKGVATYIGTLLGIYWPLGLAFCVTWLIAALLFRYSSLAALIAAIVAPISSAFVHLSIYYMAAITLMSIILFWRHRSNIRNLIAGKEDRLGKI